MKINNEGVMQFVCEVMQFVALNWPSANKYCQAQPKLQVKQSLKAELALFPFDPATPTHPHPRESIISSLCAANLNQT